MEFMGIGKDKGVKLFAELDYKKGCGLIRRKKQGFGKTAMIYVMNFNTEITEEKDEENDYIKILNLISKYYTCYYKCEDDKIKMPDYKVKSIL